MNGLRITLPLVLLLGYSLVCIVVVRNSYGIKCTQKFRFIHWLPVVGNEEISGLVVCLLIGYS